MRHIRSTALCQSSGVAIGQRGGRSPRRSIDQIRPSDLSQECERAWIPPCNGRWSLAPTESPMRSAVIGLQTRSGVSRGRPLSTYGRRKYLGRMRPLSRTPRSPVTAGLGAILPVRQHGERLFSGMAQKPPMTDLGRKADFRPHPSNAFRTSNRATSRERSRDAHCIRRLEDSWLGRCGPSPATRLAEAFIDVAEDRRAALDAGEVVLLRGADAGDYMGDARDLARWWSSELRAV
jgi:hypothetical protein